MVHTGHMKTEEVVSFVFVGHYWINRNVTWPPIVGKHIEIRNVSYIAVSVTQLGHFIRHI